MLVIACVAAVMLRDARWWARCWAWLVAIVVLGAIGVTDVLHAMSYGLRQRPTEGVVAAAPVVAVLLAFSLFLTMLRQSRPQAPDAAASPAAGQPPAEAVDRGRAAHRADDVSAVDTVPVAGRGGGAASARAAHRPARRARIAAARRRPTALTTAWRPDPPAAVTQSPGTAPTQDEPASRATRRSGADQEMPVLPATLRTTVGPRQRRQR